MQSTERLLFLQKHDDDIFEAIVSHEAVEFSDNGQLYICVTNSIAKEKIMIKGKNDRREKDEEKEKEKDKMVENQKRERDDQRGSGPHVITK